MALSVLSGKFPSVVARQAIEVRHEVYCAGRLMERCPVSRSMDPHDPADGDPETIHFVVTEDARPIGSMRLIADMEQGRRFWDGWPTNLREPVWEASRVSLLPTHRRRPDALYSLLGAAGLKSLHAGCETWIATVSENMLSALTRLGVPIELLNDGQPIDYSKAYGVHLPNDGRLLIPAVIGIREIYQSLHASIELGAELTEFRPRLSEPYRR